jgi:uncharacterized protein
LSRVERRFDDSHEDVEEPPRTDMEGPKGSVAQAAAPSTADTGRPANGSQSASGREWPTETQGGVTPLRVAQAPDESPDTEDDEMEEEGRPAGGEGPRTPKNGFEALVYALRWLAAARRGGGQGSASGGEGGRTASAPTPRPGSRWRRNLLIAVAAALVILLGAMALARFWTDLLWFGEVGYTQVFWTRIWARILVGVAGGIVFLAIFLVNILLARRLSPRLRLAGTSRGSDVLELVPTEDRVVRWIMVGISLVLAFFFGLGVSADWADTMAFLKQVPFGHTDPIFGLDASFFVFTLPFLRDLLALVVWAALLALAGTIVVYALDRALSFTEERRLVLAPHVKGHLSVLLAFLMLLKGADWLLSTWELDFSTRGVVFGASYTDVHAELPVLRFLAVISVVAAVILLVNIKYKGWRLPAASVGLVILVWLGAGQIYPSIVQSYRVSPNEIQMESPYIANNIAATRWSFGLDKVTSIPFPAMQQLTAADIARNTATIDNIRLWDTKPLLDAYTQLQEIRLYYRFTDVDVDRYSVDGGYRSVMLAARELDQNQLQEQAKTWVNQHLTYTHGFGVVVSPVNEVTSQGLPAFTIKDIPPQGATDLQILRPQIYYGEVGNEYVVVKTGAKEFDYPKGDANVFTTYEGSGGVGIGSILRQAAFSARFGTVKLLLSNYFTADSRIMYRRTISERVQAIAPFLQYDGDPYIVVRADGSLVWMWDAYTTTSRFPYSQPRSSGVNYIRNSVKVVIDAYNGGVTFYQFDPSDALCSTWAEVYPGLFKPASELPVDLRDHLRYPEDLYTMQAQVLATYHMLEPQVFYNKEDVWQIPKQLTGKDETPVAPYYVIMGLPGEPSEEFLLLQPFAPLDKKNMVAWMAARMDGDKYGQLVIYTFSKDKLVFGSEQVEARISNDPVISGQLTLWDQAGSSVIRGNLFVIPIEDSILYVEPLYLQASQSPIPELTRVIVSYEDRVSMQPTLAEALDDIFSGGGTTTTSGDTTTTTPGSSTTTTQAPPTSTTTVPVTTTTTPGTALPTDRASLIALAQQHYDAALAAQRAGDWTEYGRQIDELGRVLTALSKATQ